jgi:hypothetical protein
MIRKSLLIVIFVFLSIISIAQIGGTHTYSFLDLVNSARVASMGGNINAINDNDLNLVTHNPALLSTEMSQSLVLNYVNYFTDVNYGFVSYAREFKNYGMFAAGIQYINYGKFIEADDKGLITGEFKASEYAIHLTYSRPIDSLFSFGINIKPIISNLEKYSSFGIAGDFGVLYTNRDKLFSAALVIKNLGIQLKGYTSERESLPLNIQVGISQKFRHAPLRFSIIADHLETLDLTYEKPEDESDPIFEEEESESAIDRIADQVMRHIIIGAEFSPLENLYIRAGYNYRRRKEMIVDSKTGMVGFSWGFGVKISKFHISYGRATYHLAGASDHFSISTNLESFYKRK